MAKPDTILGWCRKLVAQKCDGSRQRGYPGRPCVSEEVESLIVRMTQENSGWGYDRIVGAMFNLGHRVSDQTVGNILRRHGIGPAPKRSQITTWKSFLAAHMNVLAARDFFTVELLTWRGLVTHYVLFLIQLETRRVTIAGVTRHPDEAWMQQAATNATLSEWGSLSGCEYLIHDRYSKFCASFRKVIRSEGVSPIVLPPKSPNLNAFAERWVRSVKQECLSKLILFNVDLLWRVLQEFTTHYHASEITRGKGNLLLFPSSAPDCGEIRCRQRLGGLLNFYERVA